MRARTKSDMGLLASVVVVHLDSSTQEGGVSVA